MLKMCANRALLLPLVMLMCGVAAAMARPSRGLLQSFPVAPNTTGIENAGFVFGSEVGGELTGWRSLRLPCWLCSLGVLTRSCCCIVQ